MLDALIYGLLIMVCVVIAMNGCLPFIGIAALFGCMLLANLVNQGNRRR
jgi:hypothetical protein